jgi:RNA-directed DNA polymerase
LLANVYLHRLDRAWDARRHGVLVRFADDVVVMCASREQAEAALARLRVLLAELGLEPKQAKTRIVHLAAGGSGFDFLGFHHRLVRSDGRRSRKRVTFLARWPTDKAMQRARDRLRELTDHSRLRVPIEEIVGDMNRFLRGWTAYFRYGNSTHRFEKMTSYARLRLTIVVAKRHQRRRGWGRSVVFFQSPNQLGLVGLTGLLPHPDPSGTGGKDRMPAVNDVGKPCAGEPHARIDGRELETGRPDHGREEERPDGKPTGHRGFATYRQVTPPRQLPTLRPTG